MRFRASFSLFRFERTFKERKPKKYQFSISRVIYSIVKMVSYIIIIGLSNSPLYFSWVNLKIYFCDFNF